MSLTVIRKKMIQYVELGKKPKWGYFPKEGHPQVVTKFEGTKATPEFLQAIAYEVYVKNVTFGLLHQWLTDMGMSISTNTLRNWLKKGKKYLDQLIVVLKSIALEKDSIVNCDETWCKVRKYDHYKRSRLDAELAKDPEFRSQYYTEALHYLKHFGNELFAFLDDGELPIDNNLAERCIRKLTTQRNSMLHFGSDEGVEMAATYHSIISTVKLHGKSAWNFLGTFFKKIFNGCRDFICLTPGNIEMAVCQ